MRRLHEDSRAAGADTRTAKTLNPLTPGFVLPSELEASEPPEARGLERDQVKMLVSCRASGRIEHGIFRDLPGFLAAGDVLVINTSGTLPAAVQAVRENGEVIELHFSTKLPDGCWSIELRRLTADGTRPLLDARAGESLQLPAGARASLRAPHAGSDHAIASAHQGHRLWRATILTPHPLPLYLQRYGFPIRYRYVPKPWPISFYQSVFVTEAGSAEMPSAGRALTSSLIASLIGQGVRFAPTLLHTGVASLESHEPPYAEFFCVPQTSAAVINLARTEGRRIIAVGTTSARALESAVDEKGRVQRQEAWTEHLITPATGVRVVDAILTGLHEPQATHVALLEAIGGRPLLERSYREMLARGYLWHEFGDLHLILP